MTPGNITQRQRTVVACIPCRRRKVKCNGAKPNCRHCLQVRDKCQWPVFEKLPESAHGSRSASPDSAISHDQATLLLTVFFSTPHLAFVRQSIHQPSFEAADRSAHSPFLLFSMYALAALHVSETDGFRVFNGESAAELSHRLATAAQRLSRVLSDEPSVAAVQANTLLSLRELYGRSITKAWMYAGVAIRMAQEMRLGKEYFRNQAPRNQEIRRRALWTCFIMDRLLCFLTARPQVFRTRHLSLQLPCPARNFLFDEAYRGPGLADFLSVTPTATASAPATAHQESTDVLPYLLKAVDLWSVLIDLFGTVGNASPQGLMEYEDEFWKAHNAVLDWTRNLPPRMTWSMRSYRTFCLLGEGSLFVSLHMLLHHALCTLQQAHLPQSPNSLLLADPSDTGWRQDVALTCCHHAREIAHMASSLYYSGDAKDREMLRSPFSGAAIMSSACVHLWSFHSQSPLSADTAEDVEDAGRTVSSLVEILRSWKEWPIAASWIESIELINGLYTVAYRADGPAASPAGLERIDRLDPPPETEPATGPAGLPEPSSVSPRLFEKIRHIMFTISEPTARRRLQSHLHIRNLWSHMSLQAQMTAMNSWMMENTAECTTDSNLAEIPFGWNEFMTLLEERPPGDDIVYHASSGLGTPKN